MIFVALELCVRESLNAPSVTSETCVWLLINKVFASFIFKILKQKLVLILDEIYTC